MSNTDKPAGATGGDNTAPTHPALAELPSKIRVHALAKLLGASSKDIIAALADIGEPARSVQSSLSRDIALKVADTLLPAPAADPSDLGESTPVEEIAGEEIADEPQPVAVSVQQPAVALAPLFAAPSPVFLPPQAAEPEAAPKAEPAKAGKATAKSGGKGKAAKAEGAGPRQTVVEKAIEPEPEDEPEDGHADDDLSDDGDAAGRRRRRRGRRGRGRGKGGFGDDYADDENADDEPADSGEEQESDQDAGRDESDEDGASDEGGEGGSRRRRRRRRRKSGADDEAAPNEDDPPNTVVHVRDARDDKADSEAAQSEVRSVRGSTRLEAKRQRRRDGREAGRRRVPVLSEAEFLARREAVDRTMVVRERGDRTQIGVLEDGVLVEHFVTSAGTGSLVGNVYLGRVQNVLPSMEAAFIDIGRGRNAVLYAGEVDWDAAGLEGKARKIEQALSTGDSVLVQVTKDPVGHKGARLTTQISLPGRFLVYVPGGGATGISRKLADNERKRLKDILKRVVPDDAGVIIRTASEGIGEEELGRDVRRLQAQWQVIKEKADQPRAQAPQLLYEEPDLLVKVVRDLFTEDFSNLVVQGDDAWDVIDAYVQHVAPDLRDRLRRHVGTTDAFVEHRIDEQLLKALDRKVWLPSGGYLIIDRTEAMTVIDVNTGKYTGSGGNLEETVTRNNLESAEEIVRQLRLRDIGGIIVIDFIDMVLESNRDLVLRRLTECLGRDRTRHQVAEVTSLGLVQMTRKRVGTGLLEAFSTTCEHCRGRGVLVSTEPVQHSHGAGGGEKEKQGGQQNAAQGGGQQQSGRKSRRGKSGEQQAVEPAAPVEAVAEPVADAPVAEPAQQETEPAAEPKQDGGRDRREAQRERRNARREARREAGAARQEAARAAEAATPAVAVEAAAPVAQPEPSAEPAKAPLQAEQGKQAEPKQAPVEQAEARPAAEPAARNGVPSTEQPALNGHAPVEERPEPPAPVVATTRRRTSRRAASRPAGPPLGAVQEG
ncbi:Rne/Rng family ribonuclease [Solihabitans fulvus]|uniref:Ribonuclease E n=1 Tax=Solihabitans fulvus TaxID=1892852 RepID=A0A5B2XTG1_9PSEU|nr:translation initiation factor IF-2 N-terminal domain-containing protein [Solihabitans fulvus]KAA2266144.1 Rne/Rng family ribonuclease [Solihabitans fulvus]